MTASHKIWMSRKALLIALSVPLTLLILLFAVDQYTYRLDVDVLTGQLRYRHIYAGLVVSEKIQSTHFSQFVEQQLGVKTDSPQWQFVWKSWLLRRSPDYRSGGTASSLNAVAYMLDNLSLTLDDKKRIARKALELMLNGDPFYVSWNDDVVYMLSFDGVRALEVPLIKVPAQGDNKD
ncbi:MAG: hypothetical protein IT443_11120 [Phycisphaeraceae bacterium]|nr:hypothetical protein [Phycisphaeraceae bacterium]